MSRTPWGVQKVCAKKGLCSGFGPICNWVDLRFAHGSFCSPCFSSIPCSPSFFFSPSTPLPLELMQSSTFLFIRLLFVSYPYRSFFEDWVGWEMLTIVCKIVARMIFFLFSNYFGDYSYSFQVTVTVSLFSCRTQLQETIPLNNSQGFSAITDT